MRALVTGGGGFLGQHLVRALLARGVEVRVLSRGRYPALERLGAECLSGDVCDPDLVARAVKHVDSVFHTAARVGYWGSLAEFEATNVGGTLNVIEAACRAGASRLVFTSSASVVIGDRGRPWDPPGRGSWLEGADESLPYPRRHLTPYSASKAKAEALVLAANGRQGLVTCAIRPHFIFGPADQQVVPRILERARKGTLVRVGDGTNKVDVTYVDNAVDAHLLAHDALGRGDSPVAGQAYFIGQERPVLVWEFIDAIVRGFGERPIEKRVPLGPAYLLGAGVEGLWRLLGVRGEPPITRSSVVTLGTSHWFRHDKARRDFGYAPRVTLEEGLARLFAAEGARSGGQAGGQGEGEQPVVVESGGRVP